jgi:hypothetical protein
LNCVRRETDRRVEELRMIHKETSERVITNLKEENLAMNARIVALDNAQKSLSAENVAIQQKSICQEKENAELCATLRSDLLNRNAELSNLQARFEVCCAVLLLFLFEDPIVLFTPFLFYHTGANVSITTN